jgi:enoyl-CoA hydratase/carnithine racemase
MPEDILYEADGPVRLITINRPDRMNSLDFAANDRLVEYWHDFVRDDAARIAVITGAGGKAFCAGADLNSAPASPMGLASAASRAGWTCPSPPSRRSAASPFPAGWNWRWPATCASARRMPSSRCRT